MAQVTKVCRLCLVQTPVFYSLREEGMAEMLQTLTSIQINIDSELHYGVCVKCHLNLKFAFKIQQTFIKSNETFMKLFYTGVIVKQEPIECEQVESEAVDFKFETVKEEFCEKTEELSSRSSSALDSGQIKSGSEYIQSDSKNDSSEDEELLKINCNSYGKRLLRDNSSADQGGELATINFNSQKSQRNAKTDKRKLLEDSEEEDYVEHRRRNRKINRKTYEPAKRDREIFVCELVNCHRKFYRREFMDEHKRVAHTK